MIQQKVAWIDKLKAIGIISEVLFVNLSLNFFISLVLLRNILYIKQRFINRGIFKYV